MGRKALPETKEQVAGRVAPAVKAAIEAIAQQEERTASQTLEMLLKESPRVKVEIRKNGKARRG